MGTRILVICKICNTQDAFCISDSVTVTRFLAQIEATNFMKWNLYCMDCNTLVPFDIIGFSFDVK